MAEWSKPRSLREGLEVDIDGLRATIHRLHGVDDLWFGTCHAMGVDRHELTASDIDSARDEFLVYLDRCLDSWRVKLAKANATRKAQP